MKPGAKSSSLRDVEAVAANWIVRRDAGLTAAEAAEFARWRAADPQHEDALARKEMAWTTLGRPLDAGQADWLLHRLAERAKRRRRRLVGTAAAMLLLAIGVVSFPRYSSRESVARRDVLLPETRALPDGSVVELRPGADLAVEFAASRRLVVLAKGTAHFRVAEDKARPFIVQTAGVAFRAVGTAFSVEVGGTQVELLVTEGTVAVDQFEPADAAKAGGGAGADLRPQTLAHVEAGNRIVVERAAPLAAPIPQPTAISTAELNERLSWRVPRLEFSELPLAEAVELMNRYNRVQFTIHEPEISRLRISGVFRADNIETFVRLLEGTCGIEALRDADVIVLKKAR